MLTTQEILHRAKAASAALSTLTTEKQALMKSRLAPTRVRRLPRNLQTLFTQTQDFLKIRLTFQRLTMKQMYLLSVAAVQAQVLQSKLTKQALM